MKARAKDGYKLFMSPDKGMFNKNAWNVPKCYKQEAAKWDQKKPMYNAGAWGGEVNIMKCILKCITNQLQGLLLGRGNCNDTSRQLLRKSWRMLRKCTCD